MRIARRLPRIGPPLGLLIALAIAGLVLASGAYAAASFTVNSFTEDASGSMTLDVTYTGTAASADEFGFQLSGDYTINPSVVLIVDGTTYSTYCTVQTGGSAPTVICKFPPGLITPGTQFTIVL